LHPPDPSPTFHASDRHHSNLESAGRIRGMRLQTRAFAIACGHASSVAVFALTLLLAVSGATAADVPVLTATLFGYSVSMVGAIIGAMWAWAYGFVFGAGLAFAYNLSVIPPAPPPFDWDLEPGSEEG